MAIGAASSVLPTSTTAANLQFGDGSGASTGVGRAYSIATLPAAPVAVKWVGGNIWVTGGTGDHPYMWDGRFEGSIILVPGSSLSFTIVTTVMTGLGSMSWIEVPA